jgi:hypothetical protein
MEREIRAAADVELEHIRRLGRTTDLVFATGNLGAYEALLLLLRSEAGSAPIYETLSAVTTRYSSQSGILKRFRVMRDVGLLEERDGSKRSQVYLAPSERLLNELAPILMQKHATK